MSNRPARDSLRRSYPKGEVCAFRSTNAPWGLFSNFASLPVPLPAGEWFFSTAEHLFQSAKFPVLPDLQSRIAAQPTAALAAKLGRTGGPLTPTWHRDRITVMRWVLGRKREVLPDRIDTLLRRTGSSPIVEFSVRDDYWGAHHTASHYVGANVLGRLWMELRHHVATAHTNLASGGYCIPSQLGALAR